MTTLLSVEQLQKVMISNVLLYKRATVQENETRWPWLIFLHILKIQDLFLEILTLRLYIKCILKEK